MSLLPDINDHIQMQMGTDTAENIHDDDKLDAL